MEFSLSCSRNSTRPTGPDFHDVGTWPAQTAISDPSLRPLVRTEQPATYKKPCAYTGPITAMRPTYIPPGIRGIYGLEISEMSRLLWQ